MKGGRTEAVDSGETADKEQDGKDEGNVGKAANEPGSAHGVPKDGGQVYIHRINGEDDNDKAVVS